MLQSRIFELRFHCEADHCVYNEWSDVSAPLTTKCRRPFYIWKYILASDGTELG